MSALREVVPALLRGEGCFAPDARALPWGKLLLSLVLAAFAYGCVMGAFAGRPLQMLYSGLKLPLLLLVSTALCLPSFFVLNTVLGLRDDFAVACRGILAAQATLAVTLSSLAPMVGVVYLSTRHYPTATFGNGVCFLLATLGGHVATARAYRPLLARQPRHRVGLTAWVTLYVFVSIQLAWVLRPFVGDPATPTSFWREDAWSNAYVVLADLIAALW